MIESEFWCKAYVLARRLMRPAEDHDCTVGEMHQDAAKEADIALANYQSRFRRGGDSALAMETSRPSQPPDRNLEARAASGEAIMRYASGETIMGYGPYLYEYIKVWRFSEAPEEYRHLSTNGGDDDWLALVPFGWEEDDFESDEAPWLPWIQGGPGGSGIDLDRYAEFKTDEGWVIIGSHA